MKRCYALHPAFYTVLRQEPCLYRLLADMEDVQKDNIRIVIDVETLLESAQIFFEKRIVRKGNCLIYEHALKSKVYAVHIEDGAVCIDDCENPFYQLLKRKYRCLVSEEVDK